jgi:hypothetical protein
VRVQQLALRDGERIDRHKRLAAALKLLQVLRGGL